MSELADVVVVGGGIVGSMVALRAAEQGFETKLFRKSDSARPESETLRNQELQRSGLLDIKNMPEAAAHMRESGRRMLDAFAIRSSTKKGIAFLPNEEKAAEFLANAETLRLKNQVEPLTAATARSELGPFYESGGFHFRIPDAPYDLAGLLASARDAAHSSGAELVDLPVGISASIIPSASRSGCALKAMGRHIEADVIVICAGAGTPELLRELGIGHSFTLYRTPLLVYPDCADLAVPYYVDFGKKLSVSRSYTTSSFGTQSLLVGGPIHTDLTSKPLAREVPDSEADAISNLLPSGYRCSPKGDLPHTRCATFEVRLQSKSLGWAYRPDPEHFPGLITAVPPKATMGMFIAELALKIATEECGLGSASSSSNPKVSAKNYRWTSQVRPFYMYEKLDEREMASGA